MKVDYSKQFVKSAYKLSGKYKISLQKIVNEVKLAKDVSEITSCVKMVGLLQSYRARMGDFRLVFIVNINDNAAIFQLLLSRGEVYKKEYETILRRKEME